MVMALTAYGCFHILNVVGLSVGNSQMRLQYFIIIIPRLIFLLTNEDARVDFDTFVGRRIYVFSFSLLMFLSH